MKNIMKFRVIELLYLVLFTYASLSKAYQFKKFIVNIDSSPLLTLFDPLYLGLLILAIELSLVIFLVIEKTKQIGIYLGTILMILFTVYLSSLVSFYTTLPCSCGGILGNMGYTVHIAFNMLFVFFGIYYIKNVSIINIEKNK